MTKHPEITGTTLGPHVHEYVRGRRARGEFVSITAQNNLSILRGLARSFGKRPLTRFGPAAIDQWMESIGHLAAGSRRQQQSVARGFCLWMVRTGKIKKDPMIELKKVREPRRVPVTLPPEAVARVLACCPDTRARAIVHLMVFCGLRCVEVAGLDMADYDRRAGMLLVTGKGGHQRHLPVPSAAQEAIGTYLLETGWATGPLIRSETRYGRGLTPSTVSILVGKWFKEAGVKSRPHDGRAAHSLRRTAASDVLDRVGDIRVVQALLGHRHLETTAVYLRPIALDAMREAMEGREYTSPPPPAA